MKIKKICCEYARNLDIVHVLAKFGHYHSKTTVKEAWFLIPLRSETQASFLVSYHKNRCTTSDWKRRKLPGSDY